MEVQNSIQQEEAKQQTNSLNPNQDEPESVKISIEKPLSDDQSERIANDSSSLKDYDQDDSSIVSSLHDDDDRSSSSEENQAMIAKELLDQGVDQMVTEFKELTDNSQVPFNIYYIKKAFWTPQKDKILMKFAEKFDHNWKKISKILFGKKAAGLQLKKRFFRLNMSDEKLKRRKYSHKEDLMLAKYYNKYQFEWKQMAKHFESRSPVMLKNRYYLHIRKYNLLESLLKEVEEYEKLGRKVEDMEEQRNSEAQKTKQRIQKASVTSNARKESKEPNNTQQAAIQNMIPQNIFPLQNFNLQQHIHSFPNQLSNAVQMQTNIPMMPGNYNFFQNFYQEQQSKMNQQQQQQAEIGQQSRPSSHDDEAAAKLGITPNMILEQQQVISQMMNMIGMMSAQIKLLDDKVTHLCAKLQ